MNIVFEKFTLNNGVSLKNRLFMAPMTTYSANADDTVSDAELAYYKERSAGVAAVITAVAYVSKHGKGFPGQISAHDDIYIPSLRKIAQTIQKEGALAILQIFHAGRQSPAELVPNQEVLGASEITAEGQKIPRALTTEEVQAIVRDFYESTRRAIEAGFDGVEIHGANTYLLQQFFSGFTNKRTDQYGGTIENRMRFPLEVIAAVNEAKDKYATTDFIVGYRFSPEEEQEDGITLDETIQFMDVLSDEALNYLHVSLGDFKAPPRRYSGSEPTRVAALQNAIKGRLPLITVGSIYTAEDLQQAAASEADLIAVGRELLIEPNWVEKIQRGEAVETELDLQQPKTLPQPLLERIQRSPGWVPMKN